jgi:hypothetical protein
VVALLAAGVLLAGIPAWAAPADQPTAPGSGPVAASARAAVDATIATDIVSVYTARELSPATATAAMSAGIAAGGAGEVLNAGVVGLFAVVRNGQVVSAAPAGFRYPLSTTVMSPDIAGRVISRDLARTLALGGVVMNAVTAATHGVQAGDTLSVLGWDGNPHTLTVASIVPDEEIGAELFVPPAVADGIGLNRPSSVILWGFGSRAAIDQALAAAGLVNSTTRIRRSWDPPDPDATLSSADLKTVLGEFAYAGSGESITLQAGWFESHISRVTLPLGIKSWCHTVVAPALQGALGEVAAAGLAAAIDVGNTNTFGGCFHAHEVTALGSTTGGFLSRHSWGMAIDMNTVENPEGRPPTMNCDVVRIFRKWGFAWGGNFLQGDGMHFEYVGARRDQLPYPSRYCPNVVTTASPTTVPAAPVTDERARVFAVEVSH